MTKHMDSGSESFELDCLFNWMRFLTGPDGRHDRAGLVVHAYGERDDTYVVIEYQVSGSPITVHQYVLDTHDLANPLMGLVRLLKEFSFDTVALHNRLTHLDYDSVGHARLERVNVYFKVIEEYEPDTQRQASMNNKVKSTKAPTSGVAFKKRKFEAIPETDERSVDDIVKSISPFDDNGPAAKPADVEEFDEWE